MKIAICEDDSIFAKELAVQIRTFLSAKNETCSVTVFPDEASALELCRTAKDYDIIFMDINLGGNADGMELCRKLRSQAPEAPVIFVTSYENRAIEGYDVNAFSFIVKKDFVEKLPKVLEKWWQETYHKNTLALNTKNGVHIIASNDILWAESDGRCTLVHTCERNYTDVRSIQHFALILDNNDFTECFKSVYVNISKIKCVNADTLTLSDDSNIPLSRRNRKSVMEAVIRKVSGR